MRGRRQAAPERQEFSKRLIADIRALLFWKYFHREELKTLYLVHSWTMKRGRGYGFMTWNTDNLRMNKVHLQR
jgi:hypothetical protein